MRRASTLYGGTERLPQPFPRIHTFLGASMAVFRGFTPLSAGAHSFRTLPSQQSRAKRRAEILWTTAGRMFISHWPACPFLHRAFLDVGACVNRETQRGMSSVQNRQSAA